MRRSSHRVQHAIGQLQGRRMVSWISVDLVGEVVGVRCCFLRALACKGSYLAAGVQQYIEMFRKSSHSLARKATSF